MLMLFSGVFNTYFYLIKLNYYVILILFLMACALISNNISFFACQVAFDYIF